MVSEERAIYILEQRACCRECLIKDCTCVECDEAFDMAIKAIRQQTRWIPIWEGPPKENETVIASTFYGVYPEARYTKENGWEWAYESGADYWVKLEDVTAWMPLPEPYRTERSDNHDKKRGNADRSVEEKPREYVRDDTGRIRED